MVIDPPSADCSICASIASTFTNVVGVRVLVSMEITNYWYLQIVCNRSGFIAKWGLDYLNLNGAVFIRIIIFLFYLYVDETQFLINCTTEKWLAA